MEDDDDDDDEDEEERGCRTLMVCSYLILCGSAYTGSGVLAVPLNEFKDGEEDEEEEEEEDEEILLSLSITST